MNVELLLFYPFTRFEVAPKPTEAAVVQLSTRSVVPKCINAVPSAPENGQSGLP